MSVPARQDTDETRPQSGPKPEWAVALDKMRDENGDIRTEDVTLAAAEAIAFVRHYLDTSARVHTLERALGWFADEANYDSDGPDHDSKVQAYGYERARAVVLEGAAGGEHDSGGSVPEPVVPQRDPEGATG